MLVLLIEDDVLISQSMSAAITAQGHSMLWAATCDEACRLLVAEHDIQVIVLDLWLREERAEDLIYELRATCATLPPVIIHSGQDMDEIFKVAEAVGASAALQKPSSAQDLLETMGRVVEQTKLNELDDL